LIGSTFVPRFKFPNRGRAFAGVFLAPPAGLEGIERIRRGEVGKFQSKKERILTRGMFLKPDVKLEQIDVAKSDK
jgi:hypothetical protein